MSSDTTAMEPGRERDIALAGEYVLGVLPAAERSAAERRMATDGSFAAMVESWQSDLAVLDEHFAPENVPPAIAARIERRLFGDEVAQSAGLWGSLAFWRGLTLASVLVAAGLAVTISGIVAPTGDSAPVLIADLAGENAPIGLVAHFNSGNNTIHIVPAAMQDDGGHSLELWAVPGDGVPRSLGLVPPDGGLIAIDRSQADELGQGVTLAVSLEPSGGSPTGSPTGPVLVAGALQ
ncbi:anti-sigma factor [Pseudohoeflea suaedae]|uniref:Anti-sigma factor n=1 Tax=Pseudohoeflea suaedae TaxID=877384 RepID=A0A4R5PPF1_9HYPH|nr:anti-sigma factor [Pseudohoeflea suaedae]TDH38743.1 anti-sigma factor [Pseudohoeflea suaedae]